MNKATGKMVSEWDNGVTIKVPCTVDMETMEVEIVPMEIEGLNSCECEYFEPDQESQEEYGLDDKMPLCEDCKQYLLRYVMSENGEDIVGYECPDTSGCQFEDIPQ